MTLKMALKYANADSTLDLNRRFKDVLGPGYTEGGLLTLSGSVLTVEIGEFTAVNFDGAVIINDDPIEVEVVDGDVNVVLVHAQYVELGSPILVAQTLEESVYLSSPYKDWMMVAGVIDLSSGGPYTFPPASSLEYSYSGAERAIVDQLERVGWRDSVALTGDLPTGDGNLNRLGDVRLVRADGSLYWWDGSVWTLFDELPLTNHREVDHVNGITGVSVAATLEPTIVTSTTMRILPVSAGSGYNVGGLYLTGPSINTDITAASVGATRGLIQVVTDTTGTITASYRVEKAVGPLNLSTCRIVDISSGFVASGYALSCLSAGVINFAGGPSVTVVNGGTYTLFAEDSVEWVKVQIVGAVPGAAASDNYTVNASDEDVDHLLIAHYFWDGTTTLTVGADRRSFGTLGWSNISNDSKVAEIYPVTSDIRPNCVVSGGVCTDLGLATNKLVVSGPIVSYVNGQRFVTAGSDTGETIANGTTRFLYIDSAGVLTVSATDPTTVPTLAFANISQVSAAAGVVTIVADHRVPTLQMGPSDPDSSGSTRIILRNDPVTPATLEITGDAFEVTSSGVTTGTALTAGRFSAIDDVFSAVTGAMNLLDANGTDVLLSNATENTLDVIQTDENGRSLIGALHDGVRQAHAGLGVESGCAVTDNGTNTITIASGVHYDWFGRRIERTVNSTVILASNNTFVIQWNASLNSGAGGFEAVTHGTGSVWNRDLPFAVVVRAGAVITTNSTCLLTNAGSRPMAGFTCGTVSGANSNGAMFATLREAMVHANCYASGGVGENIQKAFIVSGTTETASIASSDADFANSGRLVNCRITAAEAADTIAWTFITPLIDDIGGGIEVNDITFNFTGAADGTNDDIVVLKTSSAGVKFARCDFGSGLSHAVYHTGTDVGGSSTTPRGLVLEECGVDDIESSVLYLDGASVVGKITVVGGAYIDTNGTSSFGTSALVYCVDPSVFGLAVLVDDTNLGGIETVFVTDADTYTATLRASTIRGCESIANVAAMATMENCLIRPTTTPPVSLTDLDGVYKASGLRVVKDSFNRCTVRMGPQTQLSDSVLVSSDSADFGFAYFDASNGFGSIVRSSICLGGSVGSIAAKIVAKSGAPHSITNVSVVYTPDGSPSTGDWLEVEAGAYLDASSVLLVHGAGAAASTRAMNISGDAFFKNCVIPQIFNENCAVVTGSLTLDGGSYEVGTGDDAAFVVFGEMKVQGGAVIAKTPSGSASSMVIQMENAGTLQVSGAGTRVECNTGSTSLGPTIGCFGDTSISVSVTSGATIFNGNGGSCVQNMDNSGAVVPIVTSCKFIFTDCTMDGTSSVPDIVLEKDGTVSGTNSIQLRNVTFLGDGLNIDATSSSNRWTTVNIDDLYLDEVELDVRQVDRLSMKDVTYVSDTAAATVTIIVDECADAVLDNIKITKTNTGSAEVQVTDCTAATLSDVKITHSGSTGTALVTADDIITLQMDNTVVNKSGNGTAEIHVHSSTIADITNCNLIHTGDEGDATYDLASLSNPCIMGNKLRRSANDVSPSIVAMIILDNTSLSCSGVISSNSVTFSNSAVGANVSTDIGIKYIAGANPDNVFLNVTDNNVRAGLVLSGAAHTAIIDIDGSIITDRGLIRVDDNIVAGRGGASTVPAITTGGIAIGLTNSIVDLL
jgi:hypothetical protein